MYGANLINAISVRDDEADFKACGGDKMYAAGAELLHHYQDMAFMGFKEVIANLWKIKGYLDNVKADLLRYDPDVVVLIDYPGFNLRIAEYAKRKGYRVVYYISPQVWAWKASRVKKIKKVVDEMIVILPFEPDFYAKYDFPVHYAGHPLMDVVESIRKDPNFHRENFPDDKPIVALLPGSRRQEISKMLPVMLKVTENFPDYRFAVAAAPSIEEAFYQEFIGGYPRVTLIRNDTYQLFMHSEAGIVTSGTATLEAALFEMPQVVGYKGSKFSMWLGRMLVNVSYISLVNLILNRKTLEELIQKDFTVENLERHLDQLVHSHYYRQAQMEAYQKLKNILGGPGASKKAASIIYHTALEARDDREYDSEGEPLL